MLTPKSLLALLWPLLLVWLTQGDQHLLVWHKADVPVYPSRETGNQQLPLTFAGDSAKSVTLLAVHIVNDGKRTIGTETSLWTLRLKAVTSSRVAIVTPIRFHPAGLVVASTPGSDPQTVALNIGAFQPGAQIDVTLMLVNRDERRGPLLELATNLEGLPRDIGWGSPVDRLGQRLFLPILLGMIVILTALRALELRRQGELTSQKLTLRFIAGQLLLLLIGSAFVGYFITIGLAWVLLRLM